MISEFSQNVVRSTEQIIVYCQYIAWFLEKIGLITSDEQSASLLEKLKEHVRYQLDIDWDIDESLSKYFERVTTEARSYLQRSLKVDAKVTYTEMMSLINIALEKRKKAKTKPVEHRPTTTPKVSVPVVQSEVSAPTVDPEVDTFIQTVVETDQFSKLYFERLRKAANGDTFPIVNMIVGFSKRLEVSSGLVGDAARRFLEYSRNTLGAPDDAELWELIVTSVWESISE